MSQLPKQPLQRWTPGYEAQKLLCSVRSSLPRAGRRPAAEDRNRRAKQDLERRVRSGTGVPGQHRLGLG